MKTSPFTIIIDTREQTPFVFDRIRARDDGSPIIVRTERGTMNVGDYGARTDGGVVVPAVIERKSRGDLFGTLGSGRERFEDEVVRAHQQGLQFHLVLECDFAALCDEPPPGRVTAKQVFRTFFSWSTKWPQFKVWPCTNRAMATQATYRLLEYSCRLVPDNETEVV